MMRLTQMARLEGVLIELQDLIQSNGASHLGIVKSTTIRNKALVGLLINEQSIEKGAFFQGTICY